MPEKPKSEKRVVPLKVAREVVGSYILYRHDDGPRISAFPRQLRPFYPYFVIFSPKTEISWIFRRKFYLPWSYAIVHYVPQKLFIHFSGIPDKVYWSNPKYSACGAVFSHPPLTFPGERRRGGPPTRRQREPGVWSVWRLNFTTRREGMKRSRWKRP